MRLVLVLLVASLAGCADLLGGDEAQVCPTAAEKSASYMGAEAYMEALFSSGTTPYTMNMVGTIEGEIDDVLIKFDPVSKAIYLRDSSSTITVQDPYLSFEDEDMSSYSRNYDTTSSMYEEMVALMGEDDTAGVSFLDDMTVDDYQAACSTLAGVEVIEFSYNSGGNQETLISERFAPFRPLSGITVDPALQDNFRISISYDRPTITFKDTLERTPITWILEAQLQEFNDRDGIYTEATFVDGTEWAPFSELEFHLVDSEGTVYVEEPLGDGAWDLGDGDYFQYDDLDGNGMLSPGDEIIMDLGPDLDIQFFDLWANQYTI